MKRQRTFLLLGGATAVLFLSPAPTIPNTTVYPTTVASTTTIVPTTAATTIPPTITHSTSTTAQPTTSALATTTTSIPPNTFYSTVMSTTMATTSSTSSTSSTTTILPDTAGPSLVIASHANGAMVSTETVTLSGTASDSGRGNGGVREVTVNGSRADNDRAAGGSTANWSKSLTLLRGTNRITVTACDDSPLRNPTSRVIAIHYLVATGDLSGNGSVDLPDAIIGLKIVGDIQPSGLRSDYAIEDFDVNSDGQIGQDEILYILQKAALIRGE